jgi:uncharacterized protein YjbJ (UPF0337 family)
MNWEQMEGNWKQIRAGLLARWGNLTDDDLDGIAGKRERLIGKLRETYGLTSARAEAELLDWERHQEPIEHPGPTK